MARIRSIKPEFWTDEKVVELSAFARLLFIGLWNFADDSGRLRYSPKRIKMQILPGDDVDIGALLGEIEAQGLVTVYAVGDDRYLAIKNFDRHQKVDKRVESQLPPPTSAEPRRIPPTPAEPSREIPLDQGRDQGREGNGSDGDDRARVADAKRSVMEAMGVLDDPRWLGDGGRVEAWMNSGADIHRDILPTIKSVMAKRGAQGPPSSLKYFDRAVMDAHATRTTPAKPGTPHAAPSSRDQTELRRAGLAAAFNEFAGADPGSHRPD